MTVNYVNLISMLIGCCGSGFRQLLCYGRRIPLSELDARIDVSNWITELAFVIPSITPCLLQMVIAYNSCKTRLAALYCHNRFSCEGDLHEERELPFIEQNT